jgi:PHD/YefM family antitoxin component YafN of YafNO toxin-antitoxin module
MLETSSSTSLTLEQFTSSASKIINDMKQNHQATIITENGVASAVMLSTADYMELTQQAQFIKAIKEGLDDVQAGNLISDDELSNVLAKELAMK